MVFRMMAVLAEYERDLISERTRTALAHKRENGYKTGGTVPFGFDVSEDGRLVENPAEQETITLIASLRTKGYSLRAICTELERKGINTKTGAKWSGEAVRKILAR